MAFLGERLRQDNPESGDTTVLNTVHDRQCLEQAVADVASSQRSLPKEEPLH